MEIDCHTPTPEEAITFSFNRTPTIVTDSGRLREAHNLKVDKSNVRCYTPNLNNATSPGLSPIYGPTGTPLHKVEFKKPNMKMGKQYMTNTNTPTQLLNLRKQISPNSTWEAVSPKLCVNGAETIHSKIPGGTTNTNLDTSKNTGFLNRTLNMFFVLKNIGLEQYADDFARESIDFEKFLDIKWSDLKKMGFASDEHCLIIMELLKELNEAS